MSTIRDRRTMLAFVAMSVLGGGNAVGVRFSNRELEPFYGASIRFFFAMVVAIVVVRWVGHPLPRGRALLGPVLFGALNFGGAFAFAYLGLVEIQAGLGQTILALVPLATLLLAVAVRQEQMTAWGMVGTLLAVAGIAVVSGAGVGDAVPFVPLLYLIAASFCFAAATVVVRRFEPVEPVTMNAIALAVGTAVLVVLSVGSGERWEIPTRAETLVAIAYLATLGTVVVFGLYVMVVRAWNASRASFTFVVVPIVAVLLSAWLDDESIGIELLLGGGLVLAGVYLGALRPAHLAAMRAE